MKVATAFAVGVLFTILLAGAEMSAAQAGDLSNGITKASLTMTEGAGNVVVLQEPPRASRGDAFISLDTVIIGCTAGAAAGALAIALPVMTVASSGIGLPASASAVLSTAGIGCAVGVVSGLAAIGTAWGLAAINTLTDSGGN